MFFLYQDFDTEQMLSEVTDQIVQVAFKMLREHEDYNDLLRSLTGVRTSLMELIAEDNEVEMETILRGYDAEDAYQKLYQAVYRLRINRNATEDDCMGGYCAWDIDWENASFTRNELKSLAECEISYYKHLGEQLRRMN
jgi:hypothetical protein